MCRAMRKTQGTLFDIFAARLVQINKYLPFFTGSIEDKKMALEELNYILIHAVPNGWANQSHLQKWYYEGKTYKETCKIFERMEIAKQVYKWVKPSKATTRADSDHASHSRKQKGGEST